MSMITIASPNTDRSLLTLAELRAAAGPSAADGNKDTELTLLGSYVSAAITKACKVAKSGVIPPTLRLETVTQTILCAGRRKSLVLARRPVVDLVSVTLAGSALSTSAYHLDYASGIIYRKTGIYGGYLESVGSWYWWTDGEVIAEYSAGFEIVPDDLKYAAIKFVRAELTTGSRDPLLKSIRIEGVSQRDYWVDPGKTNSVPGDVMDMLLRGGYVDMVIA